MTRHRQMLGHAGEAHAARFLEHRGYRIVARNVRAARVEIDLIVARGSTLVFVEVKTRRAIGSTGFGDHAQAAEAVDAHKQARLRRGAGAWLSERTSFRPRRVRFDVVTCLFRDTPTPGASVPGVRRDECAPAPGRWSVKHWESAF